MSPVLYWMSFPNVLWIRTGQNFFFFLLVCFSWTRINLLKSVCLWEMGICVEGGGRYIYLPNLDFLRKASWFLQELSQQWLTVVLDSFSLSPCSLPDISHRIIFPWRTYCIWKCFLRMQSFTSVAKDKGEKNRISPKQFPPLHYHFFPRVYLTPIPTWSVSGGSSISNIWKIFTNWLFNREKSSLLSLPVIT